jgi:hypothetical protein
MAAAARHVSPSPGLKVSFVTLLAARSCALFFFFKELVNPAMVVSRTFGTRLL